MSNAVYKNQAAISPSFDANVKCGTGLVLGATNDLPIPVHYDLGIDEYNNIGWSAGDETAIRASTSTGFTLTVTVAGTNSDRPIIYLNKDTPFEVGKSYLIEVTPTAIQPEDCIVTGFETGQGIFNTVPHNFLTDGTLTVEINNLTSLLNLSRFNIYFNGTNTFGVYEFDVTIKQITTTGYLTYETDDGVVQLGNAVDGGSSELVDGGDFSNGMPVGFIELNSTIDTSGGTGSVTAVSNRYGGFSCTTILELGKTYEISCDLLAFSSNGIRVGTALEFSEFNTLGRCTFIGQVTHESIRFISNNDTDQTFEIDNISVKEVLPNSTTYTLVNDTYRWAYVNENPFSEADLAAIAAEPNKIVEFAMDGTGLTNTQGVDDKFYGFRENSGAYCVDALAGYGVNTVTEYSTSGSGGDSTLNTTLSPITDGFKIVNIGDPSPTNRPYVNVVTTMDVNAGDICVTSFNADIKYGNLALSNFLFSDYVAIDEPLYNGENSFTHKLTQSASGNVLLYFKGSHYEVDITNIQFREATPSEIADYTETIRTNTANSQTSIQWTCAELDGAGVPTAYNSTPNTAIMHSDTQILTGYTPSATPYSIEETVTGDLTDLNASGVSLGTTSQRTEVRLLTTDGTTHKLYINGLLQGYAPSVPSASTEIDLNDTCVIGYEDTIDSREADLKVWTTVRTDAQALADYNAWVLEYQDALTDGNGDYITTADGQYLYT